VIAGISTTKLPCRHRVRLRAEHEDAAARCDRFRQAGRANTQPQCARLALWATRHRSEVRL
jgi:hypothetical protein